MLQGDIFSPVSFIAGLDKIFKTHDVANSGVVVGNGDSSVLMSKFEYADDAALIDGNTTLASARVTALAEGSLEDAAMLISVRKSKAMHVHRTSVWTPPRRKTWQHLPSRTSVNPADANSPNSAV